MTLHSLYMQRPVKVVTLLAVFAFVWIWLASVRSGALNTGFLPGSQIDDTETINTPTTESKNIPISPPTDSVTTGSGSGSGSGSDSDSSSSPEIEFNIGATGGSTSKPAVPPAKIAKISVTTNKLNAPVIDRAFLTHTRHNERHGYEHYIAKYQAVSDLIEHDRQHRAAGAWTKPAYILSILVAELEKPPEERLEWVFWFDADTAIMNPHTPLEIFMPPADAKGLENIDLLISSNWDGLNSGVFALRVAPWSVSFVSAVLAYPIYETARQAKDRFRDQSAFQFLLGDKESPLADSPMKGHDHWAEVPIRWFNSLPVNNAFYGNGSWIFAKNMTDCLFDNGTMEVCNDGHDGKVNTWKIMQGDLCVHFAGSSYVRDSWMVPWVERAEAELPEWSNPDTVKTLGQEVRDFWNTTNEKMIVEMAKSKIEEAAKKKERDKLEKEQKEKEELAKKEKAEKERKVKEETDMAQKQKKLDKEKEKEEKLKAKLEKASEDSKAKHDAKTKEDEAAIVSETLMLDDQVAPVAPVAPVESSST